MGKENFKEFIRTEGTVFSGYGTLFLNNPCRETSLTPSNACESESERVKGLRNAKEMTAFLAEAGGLPRCLLYHPKQMELALRC